MTVPHNNLPVNRFLELIGGNAPHFFRCLRQRFNMSWFGTWTPEALAWAEANNGYQWNVYYAANACGAEGPKTNPATATRLIFLDDDNEGTATQKEAFELFRLNYPPNIVVHTSPGRSQFLWLTGPLPLDIQPVAGRHAAEWWGTDPQVIDVARILRLPGFRNWSTDKAGQLKYPDGPFVTAELLHGHRYTEDEIRQAFGVGDHNRSGNLVRGIVAPIEGHKNAGVKRDIARPRTVDADIGQTALDAVNGGAPGTTAPDMVATHTPVDHVLAVLANIDPDADGATWRRVLWGLRAASSDAPWAYELAELWSTCATQDWGLVPFEDTWKRGDSRSSWMTLERLAGRSHLSPVRKKEIQLGLQAFKRSNPELVDVAILKPLPDFKLNRDNEPSQSHVNYRALLEICECRPRFDVFKRRVVSDGEHVDDAARHAMRGIGYKFNFDAHVTPFKEVLDGIAYSNCFDSAQDWLAAKPAWDGEPRLHNALHRWLGADDTPLNAAMLTLWLIGAVRRILHPGCKCPSMLVLHGRQGLGKSAFFEQLAGQEHYNGNMHFNVDARAIEEQTRGCIVVELGELAGLRKAENERVKTFISSTTDTARAAYAQDVSVTPRRFVLGGSTNSTNLLKEKGARRWWFVKCNPKDDLSIPAFKKEVDQLWAEAIALEPHYGELSLPDSLRRDLAIVHTDFRATSELTDSLSEIAHFTGRVPKEHIWEHCGFPRGGKSRHAGLQAELREHMEENGWTEKVFKVNRKATRGYERIVAGEDSCIWTRENGSWKCEPLIVEKDPCE